LAGPGKEQAADHAEHETDEKTEEEREQCVHAASLASATDTGPPPRRIRPHAAARQDTSTAGWRHTGTAG
jgi:hypothetical protein